jgi:hypothetical protein
VPAARRWPPQRSGRLPGARTTRADLISVGCAEHAHDGGRRRVLAFLVARGDDEPGGDVAQAQLRPGRVQRRGEDRLIGDGRACSRLAAGAGRLVAAWSSCRRHAQTKADTSAGRGSRRPGIPRRSQRRSLACLHPGSHEVKKARMVGLVDELDVPEA